MDNLQVLSTVLLLYLAVGTNFLKELFSCELQAVLNNSVLFKNILGVLVLYYTIVSTTVMPGEHPVRQLLMSALLYFVFFLTTRCDYRVVMALFAAAVVITIGNSIVQHRATSGTGEGGGPPRAPAAVDEDKQAAWRSFRHAASTYVVPLLGVVLICGVVGYVGYKYRALQRSGGSAAVRGFDWRAFVAGVPSCPAGIEAEMRLDQSLGADLAQGAQVITSSVA